MAQLNIKYAQMPNKNAAIPQQRRTKKHDKRIHRTNRNDDKPFYYSDNEVYKMNKYLLISLRNANGPKQHSSDLKAFIINHNIEVISISETHFTNRTFFRLPKYIALPDHNVYRGTAMVIKNSIR